LLFRTSVVTLSVPLHCARLQPIEAELAFTSAPADSSIVQVPPAQDTLPLALKVYVPLQEVMGEVQVCARTAGPRVMKLKTIVSAR